MFPGYEKWSWFADNLKQKWIQGLSLALDDTIYLADPFQF